MKNPIPSATLAINALAKQKKSRGEKVFNFAAGDPAIANHPSILKKTLNELERKYCPYPPIEGLLELRKGAANWINETCQTDYSAQNVTVTCGGKFALFAILCSFLEPGQEVLIQAPYWVSYPTLVQMGGGLPRIINTSPKNGWKLTPEDLKNHASSKSKMLIFNNACNPTGVLYTREEIAELLNVAKELDLIVISDEVYSGLAYEEAFISCGSFYEHKERVFIVQSCSKNFAMTGWRVGFALGPESLTQKLGVFQAQSTSGVSAVSQFGALGAIEKANEVNTYVKTVMRKKRNLFIDTFNTLFPKRLEKIPSAIYAFVSLESLGASSSDSEIFCHELMTSHNVALVPGTAFGAEGYVRFAFSESEEEIVQGLQAIHNAIKKS